MTSAPQSPHAAAETARADALCTDAWLHLRAAEIEAAVGGLQTARRIFERLDHLVDVAHVDDGLGLALFHLDRPEAALQLHLRSFTTYYERELWRDAALAAGNAAWAAGALEDHNASEGWADLAVGCSILSGDQREQWASHVSTAFPLVELGRLAEAGEAADFPAPLDLDLEPDYEALANRARARLHAARGDLEEAADHYDVALDLLAEASNLIEMRCVLRERARLGV